MRGFTRFLFLALVLGAVAVSGTVAGDLQTLNLADLSAGADKIFRGRVFEARPGSMVTAVGEIPTTTYLIRVDDAFQGEFQTLKGFRVAEIVVAGSPKASLSEEQAAVVSPGPQLAVGQSYLMFTAAPDTHQLTATVGAGQGLFEIHNENDHELVFNQLKNRGLFAGMSLEDSGAGTGLNYAQMATELRATLGAE